VSLSSMAATAPCSEVCIERGIEDRNARCWGVFGRMAGSKCVVSGICRNAARKDAINSWEDWKPDSMSYNSSLPPNFAKMAIDVAASRSVTVVEANSHIGC
jgi:hypothetical protein